MKQEKFVLEYLPHELDYSTFKEQEKNIISILKELSIIYPEIEYRITSLRGEREEYELFDHLKKYQRRIRACYEYLSKSGLNIFVESLSRKFRSRRGRGYLYLKGSLILHDSNGPLLALTSYEALEFLKYLLSYGTHILFELQKIAPEGKIEIGAHEELILRYLMRYERKLMNSAVLIEWPIGSVILGRYYERYYREIMESEEDWMSKRYRTSALKMGSSIVQLRADMMIVENPKELSEGTVYFYYGTGKRDLLEIRYKLGRATRALRMLRVEGFTFDPILDYKEYKRILGERISVIEAKTKGSTTNVKEAIGQVLTYSEIVKIDFRTLGHEIGEVKRKILLPEGEEPNPLLRIVCKELGIEFVFA